MRVVVHSAGIQDRDGAALVLDRIRQSCPWLALIWADGGYNAAQVDAAVAKVPVLRMENVKRSDDMKGFVVLPRRWVVERTFSWFGRNRRLAKDFENLAAFVVTASIQIALRRDLCGKRRGRGIEAGCLKKASGGTGKVAARCRFWQSSGRRRTLRTDSWRQHRPSPEVDGGA